MRLKDNAGILIIVSTFLILNLVFLNFYHDVFWDSSVYIGMGKYIYSSGKSGLWEASRPLVLPLLLGSGWFLGLDAVSFGRFLSILFSTLAIFVTYLIGKKLFSKNIGLLGAFFTAFSFTFFFFSPNILTEIQSTLFVLLSFYFFLENRFFLMGLFSGIAIMTRLFQIFALIGIGLVFLVYFFKKQNFYKKMLYFLVGASTFILPYFFLNYYWYNDFLYPFKVQAHLTKTTGWMLYREYGFYFAGLLKENFLLVFLLLLPFFLKKNYKFMALLLTPLIYILLFSIVKHKEMRFMVVVLPFLYILLSYCLMGLYQKIKNKKLVSGAFLVMLVIWSIFTFAAVKQSVSYQYQYKDKEFLFFQNYLKDNNDNVWVTNPLYALNSNGKINGLLYFYSSQNLINFIESNKEKVDTVLFNSCDIPCPPYELDKLCGESRKRLQIVLNNFKVVYDEEVASCHYKILKE